MSAELDNMEDNASMILIMGTVGAGKSYFINKVAGRTIAVEGHQLRSGTQKAVLVPATVGREKVFLVDTPGFDDPKRSNVDILTEISKLLAAQYQAGLKLKGVIFLHRITDIRMSGAAMKTLQMCREICGENSLKNVMLVTTRWNDSGLDKTVAAQRETELRTDFWSFMLAHGSTMARFHGDKDSAMVLVSELLQKDTIVLELQRELVVDGKKLSETAAGALVNDDIESQKAEFETQRAAYEQELKDLKSNLNSNTASAQTQMQRALAEQREALERQYAQKLEEQAALQTAIAAEVSKQMQAAGKKTKKNSEFGMLPTAIALLGSFIGIPSDATDIFFEWFGDTGVGQWLSEVFGSS